MNRFRTLAMTSALTGLAAAAVLTAPMAWAQADQGQAAPNGAADQGQQAQNGQNGAAAGGALQEVVVTAERRATNLQTTPISVEALSQDQLTQEDMTRVKNLQLYTPSLSILDDGLYQAPNIRGIGNQAIIPNVTTGVAFLMDGLFSPEPHGLDEPFYDVQDVETLRGPQGTFVGYSSTGGAIEVTSQNPNFRGTNGYIELKAGNFTDKAVDGASNFTLSDTFAVRLAFNEEQMNSFYRDNGARVIPGEAEPIQDPGSTDNKDMRLSMLWKPSSSFQALGKFDYNSSNDGGDPANVNQTPYDVPAGTVCPFGSPTLAGPHGTTICHAADYIYSSHDPFVLNWGPQAYLLPELGHPYWNYRLGLHLDYYFADGIDLRSLSGWQQTQYDTYGNANSVPQTVNYSVPTTVSPTGTLSQTFNSEGASYQWIPKDDYTSEEIDLISPTTGPLFSKLNWITGATWFYRDTGVAGYSVNTSPPLYSFETPSVTGSNTENLNKIAGVFGQISWQMTQTLQWQVGARENWDNNPTRATVSETAVPGNTVPTLHITPTTPDVGCSPNLPYRTGLGFVPSPTGYYCAPAIDQTLAFEDKATTGKVDLNWTPAQGQFFYAFFARGYKAGGAQLGAPDFQPEHVNDWEVGWNGTYGNWLTTHLGGYYMIYQSMQQDVLTTATLTGGASVTNIGSSTLDGLEAQMTARVGGLGINFNASFEHTSLGAINDIVTSYELPPTARGGECGLPGVSAAECFDYYHYAARLSGEQDVYSPKAQGTIGLDYRFNVLGGVLDPQVLFSYTGGQYASLFEIPYYYVGARHVWNASLNYDVNQWNAELYVNNFTNQVYVDGDTGASVYYGAPLQIGVRVRRDF